MANHVRKRLDSSYFQRSRCSRGVGAGKGNRARPDGGWWFVQKEEQTRWKLRFRHCWLVPHTADHQKPLPGLKNFVADLVKSDSIGGNYEAARVTVHHPESG